MVSRNRDCIQREQCRVLIPFRPLSCDRAALHVVITTCSSCVRHHEFQDRPGDHISGKGGREEGTEKNKKRRRVCFIQPMISHRLRWEAYRRAEGGTWACTGWSMPSVKVARRRWEIRPTPAVRGIGRTRALMWQRARGLAQACRRGEGYQATGGCGDPNHDSEQLEMVCVEVTACATQSTRFL